MNWYKFSNLIKIAGPKEKIQALGIVDPAVRFFIYTYENVLNSPSSDDPNMSIFNAAKKSGDPEQYIQKYIKNELVMKEIYGKIDPNSPNSNYMSVKTYDVEQDYKRQKEYQKENPDFHIEEDLEKAWQIYQETGDKTKAANYALKEVNETKKFAFIQWWNYMTSEEVYKNNAAFMYSMLKPIIDSSTNDKKMGPPNVDSMAVQEMYNQIVKEGVTNVNILKKYNKLAAENNAKNAEKRGNVTSQDDKGGIWIKIPSEKNDPSNFKANAKLLHDYSVPRHWCTGAGREYTYLPMGDFHLYIKDGEARVAIRMIGNKVAEIRGHNNQDQNVKPYWKEIVEYLHNSKDIDYSGDMTYKTLKGIYLKNVDLKKGSPEYLSVMADIQKNHKSYMELSEENRKKFPEFLEIAKNGYLQEIEKNLSKLENVGEKEYLRTFEDFQNYFRDIPSEIKTVLGDIQPRIVEAHKRAFRSNPLMFPDFPPNIQATFSQEEQLEAWKIYLERDAYHINNPKIPENIKKAFAGGEKERWGALLSKNADHLKYISPEILKMFTKKEISGYVLSDFARFPIARRGGVLYKQQRIDYFVNKGLINREEVIKIWKESVRSHPTWASDVPETYKSEVFGTQNLNEVDFLIKNKIEQIDRDPSAYIGIDEQTKQSLLQNPIYAKRIGAAFGNIKYISKFRGILTDYWNSIPIELHPYVPLSARQSVIQYYAKFVPSDPIGRQNVLSKIPSDIRDEVDQISQGLKRETKSNINMEKKAMNWYKKHIVSWTPPIPVSELLDVLKDLGAEYLRHGKGSHEIWWHPSTKKTTSIPYRRSSEMIDPNTTKNIIQNLGFQYSTFEQYRQLRKQKGMKGKKDTFISDFISSLNPEEQADTQETAEWKKQPWYQKQLQYAKKENIIKKESEWKDSLPGGRADKKSPSDFENKDIEKGKKIEFEHTDNPDIATEITMDHLKEYENYYDSEIGLPNMEKKLEEDKDARGLYNQEQGDEHNPNAGVGMLQDWETANKLELEVLKRMAIEKNFTAMGNYAEQLKRKGFDQKLIQGLISAAMKGVKL